MPWYLILSLAFAIPVIIVMGFQIVVGFFSLRQPVPVQPGKKIHRFALVISARNEAAVLPHLIDSLKKQDYPADSFDIFVIADNCTDQTGSVAEAAGARVYVRENKQLIGKGYALGWFFDQFLPVYRDQFDAIGIFDADNLAAPTFLKEMNASLCAGDDAVMGYRDSKNPQDNIISSTLSISFWLLTRFYNYPRQLLGLTVPLSGTGYVFRTRLIKNGWKTRTIGEDAEFTLQLALQGIRIGYNYFARFYDEQPVDLMLSLHQRFRWAVCIYQNIRFSLFDLFRNLVRQKFWFNLDLVFFLFTQPLLAFQLPFIFIPILFVGQVFPGYAGFHQFLPLIISAGLGVIPLYIQMILVLSLEKKWSLRIIPGALLFPVFLFSNSVIFLLALFARKITWRPIAHKRAMTLDQIERK